MAQQLDLILQKLEFLGLQEFDKNPAFQKYAQMIPLGLKPSHIIFIVSIIGILLIFLNVASSLLTSLFGFLYPAYMSFKALESSGESDDRLWLTYWIIYSLFIIVEGLFGFIVSFIPFYFILKLAFTVSLFHPKTKVCLKIYDTIVKPFFIKNQENIDQHIDKAGKAGEKFQQEYKH